MAKKLTVQAAIDLLLQPDDVKITGKRFQKLMQQSLKDAVGNLTFDAGKIRITGTPALDPKAYANIKKEMQKQLTDITAALNLRRAGYGRNIGDVQDGITRALTDPTAPIKASGRQEALARRLSEKDLIALQEGQAALSGFIQRSRELKVAQDKAAVATEKLSTGQGKLTKGNIAALDAQLNATDNLLKAGRRVDALQKSGAGRLISGELYERQGVTVDGLSRAMRDLSTQMSVLKKKTDQYKLSQAERAQTLGREQLGRLDQARVTTAFAQPTTAAETVRGIEALKELRKETKKLRDEAVKSNEPAENIRELNKQLDVLDNRNRVLAETKRRFDRLSKEAFAGPAIPKDVLDERRRVEQVNNALRERRRLISDNLKTGFGTQFVDTAGVQRGLTALNQLQKEFRQLRAEAARTGKSTSELKRLDAILDRISRRRSGLKRLHGEFSKMERGLKDVSAAAREMNPHLGQSSLLVRQFFRYALGYGALYQMLGLVGQLTSGILELNKALFSIQAITASTDEQMVKISSSIKEVAVQTKFTTSEVAKAAQVLSQAGVDPDEINSVLNAVSTFAAGTESSIEIAADLVSTMRNVFNDLDDLTIANQLTKAINISKLTGEDLKTILGISAQVSKSFNLTSEQYLSAVTTLRNAGLKASTVATGLRQGLLEIFSPDSKSIKDLKQRYADLGEAVSEEELRTRFFKFTQTANPLLSVLRELDRLGFNGEGRKTLARSLDIRAANAIRALIDNIDELEESETRLVLGNSALEASATQMDSLSNSIDNLGAAMTVLSADITEGPVATLEDLVDAATEAVKALDDLHNASLAAGGEGLIPAIQTAGAGAVVGALIGRTPAQRAVGGVAGAAAGGYLGGQLVESEFQGMAEKAGDIALWLSIVIPALRGISRAIAKYAPLVAAAKPAVVAAEAGAAAAATTGVITGLRGALGKITGLFKATKGAGLLALSKLVGKLALRVVPFVGWLYLAYEVASELFGIGEKSRSDLEKTRARIKGLQRQAVKAQQEADKAAQEVDIYKFTDLEAGIKSDPGKAAGQLEDLQAKVADFRFLVRQYLGDLTEEETVAAQEVLRELRTRGTQEGSIARTELVQKLSGITGRALESQDPDLIKVVDGYNELLNAMQGVSSDIVQTIRRAEEDLANGDDVEVSMKALYDAYGEVAANQPEYLAALYNGIENVPFDDFIQSTVSMFQRAYELGSEANQRVQKQETALLKARSETRLQLTQIQGNAEPGVLTNVVNKVLGNAAKAGDNAMELLDLLSGELDRLQASLVQAVRNYEQIAESAERKGDDEKAADFRKRLEVAQRQLQEVGPARTTVQATQQAITSAIQRGNEATVNTVKEAFEAVALEGFEIFRDAEDVVKGNKGLNDLFKEIQEVATDDEGLRTLIESVTSFKDVQGNVILGRNVEALIKLLEDARSAGASVPDSSGTKGRNRPESLSYIPNADRYALMQQLEVEIEKAQKNNLELLKDAGNSLNPIVQLRKLELQEAEAALSVARQNLQNAKNFYTKDLDSYDSAEKRKAREALNKALLEVRKAELERDKIKAEAEKKINDASIEFHKQRLEYEKRRADAEKKALDSQIKSAVAIGDLDSLAILQSERFLLTTELVDIEKGLLSLQEDREEVVKQIHEANLREAQAAEQAARAQEFIAALQERTKESQGEFTTGDKGKDSYLSAIGYTPDRENQAASLRPQIATNQQAFNELLVEMEKVRKESGRDSEAFKALSDEAQAVNNKVHELTGELELLTAAATLDYQLDRVSDPDAYRRKFQELDSDITNLADNIQDNWVSGFDSLGASITDAVIASRGFENVGNVIRQMLADVFAQNARDYLSTFINSGIQQLLPRSASTPSPADLELPKNTLALQSLTLAIQTETALRQGQITTSTGGGKDPVSAAIESAAESQIQTANANSDKQVQTAKDGLVAQGNWWQQLGSLITSVFGPLIGLVGGGGSGGGGFGGLVVSFFSSLFGAKRGVANIKGYSRGTAKISGPGTGTSDSIPALVTDKRGRPVRPIRVADGESILTAKATELLGEDFINTINAMTSRPVGYAGGGVFSGLSSTTTGKKSAASFDMTKGLSKIADAVGQMGSSDTPIDITLVDHRASPEEVINGPAGRKATMKHIQENSKAVKAYVQR